MPRLTHGEVDDLAYDDTDHDRFDRLGRPPRHRRPGSRGATGRASARRRPADGRESFKCLRCKAFIGPTVSGGRHRNHCPLCLYSRHVDDRRPGDRASGCRSLMAPVGTFFRRKGEQAIVHRCLGCGRERHNRVAADDNILACVRLPLVAPRIGRAGAGDAGEEEAIA